MNKNIEIRAPAKKLAQGSMAIHSGADALYIGAEALGTRLKNLKKNILSKKGKSRNTFQPIFQKIFS